VTNVIAHRGASARFPENTIAAFEGAIALGADGVELDVRRTLDGLGVVHHDAELSDGRRIASLRADDVPPRVPRLAAALVGCGDLEVNVEIKNGRDDADFDETRALAEWTVAEIRSWGEGDRAIVSSFDLGTIDRVRGLDAELRTAWLVVDRGDPLALIGRAAERGHSGIHPVDRMVDEGFVAAAHAAGLFVNVWTVDELGRIRALAELGVDGVVTNVPDVARLALDDPR
jgi:glycerophosphoryl diester phosphodiesterase